MYDQKSLLVGERKLPLYISTHREIFDCTKLPSFRRRYTTTTPSITTKKKNTTPGGDTTDIPS